MRRWLLASGVIIGGARFRRGASATAPCFALKQRRRVARPISLRSGGNFFGDMSPAAGAWASVNIGSCRYTADPVRHHVLSIVTYESGIIENTAPGEASAAGERSERAASEYRQLLGAKSADCARRDRSGITLCGPCRRNLKAFKYSGKVVGITFITLSSFYYS